MPRPMRVLRGLSTAAVGVLVAMYLAVAVGPRVLPYRVVTVLSGSMAPAVPTGAVVVERPEPVSALRPGQVITFYAPEVGRPIVTHRVLQVLHRGRQVLMRTKGDANNARDPWLAQIEGNQVWRVRASVPLVGYVIHELRQPPPRLALLYLAPAVLLAWVLAGVWRRPWQQPA